MVKLARRHAAGVKNVQFELGDAADLAFEDNSVDFIVSTGSLHHWRRPGKVFDECYRILKNGQEGWIYDPCPDALKKEADTAKKEYGWLRRLILIKITEMHGFSRQEYDSKIKGVLQQSRFKDSFQMELTDMWMKTILKKSRS